MNQNNPMTVRQFIDTVRDAGEPEIAAAVTAMLGAGLVSDPKQVMQVARLALEALVVATD